MSFFSSVIALPSLLLVDGDGNVRTDGVAVAAGYALFGLDDARGIIPPGIRCIVDAKDLDRASPHAQQTALTALPIDESLPFIGHLIAPSADGDSRPA
jgi:hypothetical protein